MLVFRHGIIGSHGYNLY